MPNEKIITLSDENFDQEVLSGPNILVQFWAPWSQPCSQLSPVIDTIADEFDKKIIVYRLNIEKSPRVVEEYRVRQVPTLILFELGGEIYRKIGVINKSVLSSLIRGSFRNLNY
ncbi:thioredoxin family protein [Chitinophaga varians]|uniref:thioredoxin family protein n=1 Tax=Chitinophaga varians TaxID=2202339 RepID=UPI00165ED232|nr:thioredoxin domain-containing protein [Chitinophaga varians]MBC9910575.1 thiol reductase thioredoxin [Chitinophaga varians]